MTEKNQSKPLSTLALDKKLRIQAGRIDKLEKLIVRMAHQTGTQNILKYFDIKPYEPGQKDMRKWVG